MPPVFLIHEFVSGGGWLGSPLPPSLAREGLAMLRCLASDFATLGETIVPLDPRVLAQIAVDERDLAFGAARAIVVDTARDLEAALAEHAPRATWTLSIAPESGGCLLAALHRIEKLGGRSLGGSSRAVEIAGDKLETARHLESAGVPVLATWIDDGASHAMDTVLKPRDGAGSAGVQLRRAGTRSASATGCVVTPLREGVDASVVVLAGPAGVASLEPTRQRIDRAASFAYLGGELPLREDLATRARALAERAVASLPAPLGLFGVDLLLDLDGTRDLVVEINPRATTSLCGLSAAVDGSIAARLVAIAEGAPAERVHAIRALRFGADGQIEQDARHRSSTR